MEKKKRPPFPPACAASDARASHLARITRRIARDGHTQGEDGIGTLGEKRMHVVLKHLFCEDGDCHEIPMEGTRYVCDVRVGDEITEIQTGELFPMKRKLEYYLAHTDCTVTVVHPIAVKKWVVWIDPVTREVGEKQRLSSRERDVDLLVELFPLRHLLPHPRLRFHLLYLETLEFRLLSKKGTHGKGAKKYERIPISLLGEETFATPSDFARFLPDTLPSPFTVKQFSECTGVRGIHAYSAVRTLLSLGLVGESEKIWRAMAFEILR
jgi:hypothetical protein